MAVVSLVTGHPGHPLLRLLVLSIVAVVTGYLAKKEIAESGGAKTGGGLAQAGFILGIVGVVLGVVLLILQVTGVVDYNWDTRLRELTGAAPTASGCQPAALRQVAHDHEHDHQPGARTT